LGKTAPVKTEFAFVRPGQTRADDVLISDTFAVLDSRPNGILFVSAGPSIQLFVVSPSQLVGVVATDRKMRQ
jgi:hypothetical protein